MSEVAVKHISGRTTDQEPGCSLVAEGGIIYMSPRCCGIMGRFLRGFDHDDPCVLDGSIELMKKMGAKEADLKRAAARGYYLMVDDDLVDYAG